MERTKFEIEQTNSQNVTALLDRQEICGSETDDPGSDAERERTNDATKAVETVAWMKLLGLIR
jgi:hypothetical protein